MIKYCSIIFMHDYEDDTGLVLRFFVNEVTESELVAYLAQWDFGDESEHCESITDSAPYGAADTIEAIDGYILSYNAGLGYVGLCRLLKEESEDA